MKTLTHSKQVKPLPIVLLIVAVAVFTSCSPKYGCYYSMTETNAPENVECSESMNDSDWRPASLRNSGKLQAED